MAGRGRHIPAVFTGLVLAVLLATLLALPMEAGATYPGKNGKIAFSGSRGSDENYGIFSINPDGTGRTTLDLNPRPFEGREGQPAVSPDGTKVVFTRGSYYAGCDLYVVGMDGEGLEKLTDGPDTCKSSPTWSPDGTKIAFLRGPAQELLRRPYVMDADGTDQVPLGDRPLQKIQSLEWSPDGSKLAFDADRGIYVANADGSDPSLIADGYGPSWSPDGSKLAYTCGPYRTSSICTVQPDGSGVQKIVTDTSLPDYGDDVVQEFQGDRSPAWSPDGTRIAFSRNTLVEDSSSDDIFTMNPDGSGLQQVETSVYLSEEPDWQPVDGGISVPLDTTIFSGPSDPSGSGPASFDFVASEPGATFQCSLDDRAFEPCTQHRKYVGFSGGKHSLEVRAVAPGGSVDRTPDRWTWSVDARDPVGRLKVDGGRTRTREASVRLALRAYDPGPGSGVDQMRLKNSGGEWKAWRSYTTRMPWKLRSGEGRKFVLVKFRDEVGNVSAVAKDSISFRR